MTTMPPANRRRKVLWGLAILGMGMLAAALSMTDWDLVWTGYHAFRLDRARSPDAAEPHLDALLDLASHEPAARALVAKLGVEKQWLTYWVFRRVLRERTLIIGVLAQAESARILPWLRRWTRKVDQDPHFAAAWGCFSAYFSRWMSKESDRKQFHDDRRFPMLVYATLIWQKGPPFRHPSPEQIEAMLRFEHLHLIEKQSIWGGPRTHDLTFWADPVPSLGWLSDYAQALDRADAELYEWQSSSRDSGRVDQAQGARQGVSVEPSRRVPLPGWKGPAPPEERILKEGSS